MRHVLLPIVALIGLAVVLPNPAAPASATVSSSHTARDAAGVYVLTRAAGRPLPYPFDADLGAGVVHGDLTGARLILRADGGYDADLVVRVDPGILARLPGVPDAGLTRTVHDQGRYTARNGHVVLEPAGALTSRYDARVFGRLDGDKLALTSADLRARGEQYDLALELVRVR